LGTVLLNSAEDVVEDVMSQYPEASAGKLAKLRAAFREVFGPQPRKGNERGSAYNGETSIEFHELLIAALLGYGKALMALLSATEPTFKRRQASRVLMFARLLWSISTSRMLHYHLKALGNIGALTVPIAEQEPYYYRFTNFFTILPDGDDDPREDVDFLQEKDLDENDGAGAGGGIGNWEGNEKGQSPRQNTALSPIASAYKKCIRRLVSHFASAKSLGKHAAHFRDVDINICLLAVDRPKGHLMENWELTIKRLFPESAPAAPSTDPDIRAYTAKDAIASFTARIKNSHFPQKSPQAQTLDRFRTYVTKKEKYVQGLSRHPPSISFVGPPHCETLLVALTKYPDRAIGSKDKEHDTLKDIITVRSYLH
jgi:hypothetical protein